jgi:hypothetical protein
MCVIISIYNESKNDKRKSFLADNLKSFSKYNDDGTARYSFSSVADLPEQYTRDLKTTTQKGFESILEKYNINHFHFRNATKSKVKKDNIHFWKWENWLFAHNGICSDYENEKTADSYILFKKLIAEKCISGKHNINMQKIAKIVGGLNFWGRLILINTETKSTYYFGDWHLYLIDKNIMVVSTTTIGTGSNSFYGIEFDATNTEVVEKKMDGVFKINPVRKEFKEYDIEFSGKSYYYGNYKSYGDYYQTKSAPIASPGAAEYKACQYGELWPELPDLSDEPVIPEMGKTVKKEKSELAQSVYPNNKEIQQLWKTL